MKEPRKAGSAPRQRARKCPICGKPTNPDHSPFCSRRCAQVDLNRWLSGSYVIPGRPIEDEPKETGEE
jgi:endogenous inhibitor of DNA gyrase (YacG/DUF329 family)